MNSLKKAIKLEKKGNYKAALVSYKKIETDDLSEKEHLYVNRSIAACLFYLREYDKAIQEYEKILKEFFLDTFLKNQIEENMQLCFLYGSSAQKAIEYFKNRILNEKSNIEKKCWWYWYTGQGFQRLKEFKAAEIAYEHAYQTSKELNSPKEDFYLLYIAVIKIFQKQLQNADEILVLYKEIYNQKDITGLFQIITGLVAMQKDFTKGRKLYHNGIKKAKKGKWIENIELAEELLKVCKEESYVKR